MSKWLEAEGRRDREGTKAGERGGSQVLKDLVNCVETPEGNGKSIKNLKQGCDKVRTVSHWEHTIRV